MGNRQGTRAAQLRRASVKGCQTRLAVRRGVPNWGGPGERQVAWASSYPNRGVCRGFHFERRPPRVLQPLRPLRDTRGNRYGWRPGHRSRSGLGQLPGVRAYGAQCACSQGSPHARSTAPPRPRGPAAGAARAGEWRTSGASARIVVGGQRAGVSAEMTSSFECKAPCTATGPIPSSGLVRTTC